MLKAIIFSLKPQIKHYWLNTFVRILFYCESTLHFHCFYYCGITSCNIYVNFLYLFVCMFCFSNLNQYFTPLQKKADSGAGDIIIWISFSQASAAAVPSVWCLFSLTNYCIVILFFTNIHATQSFLSMPPCCLNTDTKQVFSVFSLVWKYLPSHIRTYRNQF